MLSFRVKNLQILLHASSYKRAAPWNNPFLPVESDFDDPDNYEQDRRAWIDIKDEEQLSPILRLTTRLYGDTFDYQRFMNISASAECLAVDVTTCRYRNIGVARWAGAEVQTSWDWLGNGTLVTLLGADGRTRFVSSADDLLDKATGAPAASTVGYLKQRDEILGAYLQQTWQPAKWFSANVGGRLDFDERFGRRLLAAGRAHDRRLARRTAQGDLLGGVPRPVVEDRGLRDAHSSRRTIYVPRGCIGRGRARSEPREPPPALRRLPIVVGRSGRRARAHLARSHRGPAPRPARRHHRQPRHDAVPQRVVDRQLRLQRRLRRFVRRRALPLRRQRDGRHRAPPRSERGRRAAHRRSAVLRQPAPLVCARRQPSDLRARGPLPREAPRRSSRSLSTRPRSRRRSSSSAPRCPVRCRS